MLQFADETLFLGKATVHNILTIKSVLRCFELVSGLKINFHKSKLAGIGVEERETWRLASLLNCKVMKVPINLFWRKTNFDSKCVDIFTVVLPFNLPDSTRCA